MQEIIVTVDESGAVTLETKGFQGKACKDATASMKRALGETVSEEDTAEMRHTATNQNINRR